MENAVKWNDDYEDSRERTVLTQDELGIPGVRIFASLHPEKPVAPLVWHYHENAFEFSFVTQGNIIFNTRTKAYDVNGGHIHISFPNEVHASENTPLSSIRMYWMQIDTSDPSRFLFLDTDTANKLIASLNRLDKHIISTDNGEIRKIIEHAFHQCIGNGNPYLIAGYLVVFLNLLLDFASKSIDRITPDIRHALNEIDSKIGESISLEELAASSNLSVSQFKQKFSNVVGIPPRQYINRKKIEYSKQLLLSGMSITDIAMSLDFTSSSYYATVFKKYQACTPSEYIERHNRHF